MSEPSCHVLTEEFLNKLQSDSESARAIVVCKTAKEWPKGYVRIGETNSFGCPNIPGERYNAWIMEYNSRRSEAESGPQEPLSIEETAQLNQLAIGTSAVISMYKETPTGWAVVGYAYDPGCPEYNKPEATDNNKILDNAKIIVKQQ